MGKHHPLPNPSRYKWDTEKVTVYQIPIDDNDYREKLDRVAEALYALWNQLSEKESFDSPEFNLSRSHQGNALPNSNEGTGLSGALGKDVTHENIFKKAA